MPSKTKKHAKAQSILSTSEVATPTTPSLMSNKDSEVSEQELMFSCEEASKKYPSFIGKSAFVGNVNDVESKSKGCKIWLSEPSMVSSSLAPGSIVSVNFQFFFLSLYAFEFPFSIIILLVSKAT